jgi:hypothetical protein
LLSFSDSQVKIRLPIATATLEQCLFFGQSNKVNEFYKTETPLLQGIKNGIEHFLEKDFM